MSPRPTLAAYYAVWMARQRPRLALATLENYERAFRRHLLPGLGGTRLDELTREQIRRVLVEAWDTGYRSLDLLLGALRSCLTAARFDDGLLATNPCERIRRALPRPLPPRAVRPLSAAEVSRLVAALAPHPVATLVLLGARTGLRVGELVGLRWSDVDLPGRRLMVSRNVDPRYEIGTTKGRRTAELPLSREAVQALKALKALKESQEVHDWVFPSTRRGGRLPWSRSQVRHVLRRGAQKAGLPHVFPHLLRHSFLSQLAENGESVWSIRDLARHRSILTTERYVHVGGRHVALVDRLDAR